jgi:hypothetical protein
MAGFFDAGFAQAVCAVAEKLLIGLHAGHLHPDACVGCQLASSMAASLRAWSSVISASITSCSLSPEMIRSSE